MAGVMLGFGARARAGVMLGFRASIMWSGQRCGEYVVIVRGGYGHVCICVVRSMMW